MPRFPRLSLRSVLIGINLVVLLLPVAGIQLMRLYESALVRQTESALIAQGAFIAAFYRSLVLEQGTQNWDTLSRPLAETAPTWRDGDWLPQPPTLDLASSPTLEPFPDGLPGPDAEPFAGRVGARLEPVLKDAQLVTLAGIRVVDPWGVIVASTGNDVGQSIEHGEEVAMALYGRATSRIRRKDDVTEVTALDSISRNTSIRVFVASPIVLHERLIGAVLLSRTPPSIVQALYGKRWLLLQGFLLLVGIVLIMSILTFRLIARPISRLANQAEMITTGEISAAETLSSPESVKPRTTEVARLQEAITNMAMTLEQRANYLQDFSRHVSHEFKTPIASIRGAIEVLEDHGADMDETQRVRFFENIAADAERLQRLTERLTELTRAELRQGQLSRVDLAAVVHDVAEGFHDLRVLPRHFDDVHCLGDEEVIRAVLETLFENALQHDATEISVWPSVVDETLNVYVQDNGAGISPSNREQIFEPFFTTARERGGTGLGLTIARALLRQVEGDITLNADNGPTTFCLQLRLG